ncbi:MAG: hypothetical protein WCO77_00165 [bacterium]
MAERKSSRKPVEKSEKQKIVAEALQTTWLLKGKLKSAQIAYLRIGELLVKIRDLKLDAALSHPSLEDYAEKRLQLGKSSLYRYIRVYEWVRDAHPQWLADKPEGFIPELDDVAGLMWIEKELARKNLPDQDRKELKKLKGQAFTGDLRQRDLTTWRQKGKAPELPGSYLTKLANLRKGCGKVTGMPPEVLQCLDEAITILKTRQLLAVAPTMATPLS